MKYCSHCGAQMEDHKLYCSLCGSELRTAQVMSENNNITNGENGAEEADQAGQNGQQIQQNTTGQSVQQPVQVNSQGQAPQKADIAKPHIKLSKKQWIIIGSVLCVIILGIVGYIVGASMTGKEKVASRFEQAIESKNTKEMLKYIKSTDPHLAVNEESIKCLMDYINEDSGNASKIVESIKSQVTAMDKKPAVGIGSVMANGSNGASENSIFNLVKDGKTLLLFNRYVFDVQPYFINVETDYKGTKISVDGKEVCTTDKNAFTAHIGPYMPGLHTMKAALANSYMSADKTIEVVLTADTMVKNGNDYALNVNLNTDACSVFVAGDFNDAKILVNGNDTGVLIKDSNQFGPLPKDGSAKLSAQKDFPFGTVKSPVITFKGQTDVYFSMTDISDEVKTSIMDTLNTCTKSWVEAAAALDLSKLVNAGENYKNRISLQFEDMKARNLHFKGSLTKTVYDLDSVRVYLDGGVYKAIIDCQENYSSAFYNEGSGPKLTDSSNLWTYYLIYDESSKKWLVDGDSELYNFNPKNKKEFTF